MSRDDREHRIALYDSQKNENVRNVIEESYRVNARGWGTFEDEMIGINNALENINYLAPTQKHPILLKKHTLYTLEKCTVLQGMELKAGYWLGARGYSRLA
ncbi:MAG: hypothetical protein ACTTH5_04665 [Wolinella sp.]